MWVKEFVKVLEQLLPQSKCWKKDSYYDCYYYWYIIIIYDFLPEEQKMHMNMWYVLKRSMDSSFFVTISMWTKTTTFTEVDNLLNYTIHLTDSKLFWENIRSFHPVKESPHLKSVSFRFYSFPQI